MKFKHYQQVALIFLGVIIMTALVTLLGMEYLDATGCSNDTSARAGLVLLAGFFVGGMGCIVLEEWYKRAARV